MAVHVLHTQPLAGIRGAFEWILLSFGALNEWMAGEGHSECKPEPSSRSPAEGSPLLTVPPLLASVRSPQPSPFAFAPSSIWEGAQGMRSVRVGMRQPIPPVACFYFASGRWNIAFY